MTEVPETLRLAVRARAGNRCEYCLSHQSYVMERLQVDHIIPLAKGGTNTIENLCLACELCNQHKWTYTHGVDPQTARKTVLYNPRNHSWNQHFEWTEEGAQISGLTPLGRATISVLQLNNELAVVVRRNWIQAGWHPPTA